MDTENETKTPKSQENFSDLKAFTEALEKLGGSQEKIELCLGEMRKALSAPRHPRMRDFWEIKKACLPLFKEALSPSARSHLWAAYIEISGEAKQLKEIIEQQSAFAVEQIELAISALEGDLAREETLLEKIPLISDLENSHWLRKKKESYNAMQRSLTLLNTFAAKVSGLRKEIIKVEMRMRHKNQFFDRLSKAGDLIFPRRKELIKQVSQEFVQDIAAFVKENFEGAGDPEASLFGLRDEIKALQMLAKQLTLDTQSFTKTRLMLSKCWDDLKEKEKERKAEIAQRRESYQKSVELVMDKIKLLAEKCAQPDCTGEEASKLALEISNFMKSVDLGRDEVRYLRGEIDKAQQPIAERLQKERHEREKSLQEAARQKKEKIDQLKAEIESAIAQIGVLSLEEAAKQRQALQGRLETLGLTHAEKEMVEQLLKKLRDAVIEKREKAIEELPGSKRDSIEELRAILSERKLQRQEIKAELENYRKALSASGFDFEKAMRYRELLDQEKARLDKANAIIEEIEEKIRELES